MTEYCIWGTTEPFKTNNSFFQEIRKQAFGKTDVRFCNIMYPSSYFYFTWSCGCLVLNFYNTQTNREKHIELGKKTLPYSTFTKLLQNEIRYYLPSLCEYPTPPQKTFWQVLWSIIKWIFDALFWLLGSILKGVWAIIKWSVRRKTY